ncbi:hypothetical protein PS376_06025 [Limosilactobacillus pontis]|uniref:hypothetical protein n=1 Tax=Limosilactobacillus pontis TaxID=35787 RepID=UPI002F2612B3
MNKTDYIDHLHLQPHSEGGWYQRSTTVPTPADDGGLGALLLHVNGRSSGPTEETKHVIDQTYKGAQQAAWPIYGRN